MFKRCLREQNGQWGVCSGNKVTIKSNGRRQPESKRVSCPRELATLSAGNYSRWLGFFLFLFISS